MGCAAGVTGVTSCGLFERWSGGILVMFTVSIHSYAFTFLPSGLAMLSTQARKTSTTLAGIAQWWLVACVQARLWAHDAHCTLLVLVSSCVD